MQLLNDLVGRKVTVYSVQGQQERQDVGVLENTDGQWLRLRKSDAEVLYFGLHFVRQIKPFEPH
jgi:hypothetical protein